MYNNRPHGSSRGRSNVRYHNANNNFGNRFATQPKKKFGKKLDYNLFINKAAESEVLPTSTYEVEHAFNDFDIHPDLKGNIAKHNYRVPTPIQDQAILHILAGKDVIGIANTGTGKTAAFLIPLINKILNNRKEKILIVTPTRELAMQINDEFRKFAQGMSIYSVLIIGGASMKRQIWDLSRNFNIIIGTPGRLKALVQEKDLHLSEFHTVVLDEVDRMVDIGFIHDIEFLISFMPKERHSLFFSATVDGKVSQILKRFVSDPITVSVKTQDTAQTVEQDVVHVQDKNKKIDVLHDLLIQDGFDKVMVFGRTKWGVEKLSKALIARGFKAEAIHGNKSQGRRQRALNAFKNNEIQVLLATDVASRGIDVPDVTHVINYDAPESYDDYVHRIGRTGRANQRGKAITFVE